MAKKWCLLLFILWLGTYLSALEVKAGRLKFVLFEDTGRFAVYYQKKANEFISFLAAQDPRTSLIGIIAGNETFILENGSVFRQQTEETLLGARFIFTSSRLKVIQDFTIISEGGLNFTLELTNLSESPLAVGAVILFDTWLGEKEQQPFQTASGQLIKQEVVLASNAIPDYWISPSEETVSLKVLCRDEQVTTPDRLVFANWKRLRDNLWHLRTASQSDFSAFPFSTNDSAVAHYYDPVVLKQGESRRLSLVLGSANAALTSLELKGVSRPNSGTKEGEPPFTADNYRRNFERVNILNNILEELNEKIKEGKTFTPVQLELINSLFAALKENPATELASLKARLQILNNLLADLNKMLESGDYDPRTLGRLKEIISALRE